MKPKFFNQSPPTENDIRGMYPSIQGNFLVYRLRFSARKLIKPYLKELNESIVLEVFLRYELKFW